MQEAGGGTIEIERLSKTVQDAGFKIFAKNGTIQKIGECGTRRDSKRRN